MSCDRNFHIVGSVDDQRCIEIAIKGRKMRQRRWPCVFVSFRLVSGRRRRHCWPFHWGGDTIGKCPSRHQVPSSDNELCCQQNKLSRKDYCGRRATSGGETLSAAVHYPRRLPGENLSGQTPLSAHQEANDYALKDAVLPLLTALARPVEGVTHPKHLRGVENQSKHS